MTGAEKGNREKFFLVLKNMTIAKFTLKKKNLKREKTLFFSPGYNYLADSLLLGNIEGTMQEL